jgi:hypothetical protein
VARCASIVGRMGVRGVAVRGLFAGHADYKPGTSLLFGSPALTRFIVWWTTAAGTSLVVGSIVFVVGQALR